jgi:histone deacetylase complex regulatory component SIN3
MLTSFQKLHRRDVNTHQKQTCDFVEYKDRIKRILSANFPEVYYLLLECLYLYQRSQNHGSRVYSRVFDFAP